MPTGAESLLVVDDKDLVLMIMVKSLSSLGCKITAFCDSLKALAEFVQNPSMYDLCIFGPSMPNLLGTELAGAVRNALDSGER